MQKRRCTGNTSHVHTTCMGSKICLRLTSDTPLSFDDGVFLDLSNFMVLYIRKHLRSHDYSIFYGQKLSL